MQSKGAAIHARKAGKGNRIITSSIEHDAVLEPCKDLEQMGFQVTYLPVTSEGKVRPSDLKDVMSPDVVLVSIMYANNEVGTIQPVGELAKIAHDSGVLFHSDAVQAAGKIPIDVRAIGADMLSFSSHKINGPKGVGALYVRNGVRLAPILHGGGQESMLRSGTENVPGIAGFGRACQLARERMQLYCQRVTAMREHLVAKVLKEIPHSRLNGVHCGQDSQQRPLYFLWSERRRPDYQAGRIRHSCIDGLCLLCKKAEAFARSQSNGVLLRRNNRLSAPEHRPSKYRAGDRSCK